MREHYSTTRMPELLALLPGRTSAQVLRKAPEMGLRKTREFIVALSREKSARPDHPMHAHKWEPGNKPWNTGVKGSTGTAPRCRAHQFKQGNRPHTWQPVGTYRIHISNGSGPELQLKVNEDPGPAHVRWKPVSRLVWEAANGPIPDGHIVVFKPGMRSTELARITPDVLECIDRVELMRRNTVHNLPPEFAEISRLRAVLHRAINTRTKKEAATP